MKPFLNQLPPLLKYNFRQSTLVAIAAGCGAAAGCGMISFYYLIFPVCFLIFLNKRQIAIAATVFLLCLASGIFWHVSYRKQLSVLPKYAEKLSGTLVCTDTRISNAGNLPELSVVNCRVQSNGSEFDAAVIFPHNSEIFYNRRFSFQGKYYPPQPAGLICRNGKITGEYPPVYGDRPLVIVDSAELEQESFSFMKYFFQCREIMLNRLLYGIKNQRVSSMAAKLFFGASSGAPVEIKENFIESGIIHLFSVSGLHVMIIAAIFTFLLCPLPFSLRHQLIALITIFYVLCTGASLPAVRAGSMIVLWCIMRSKLYPSSNWDAMMYVWSIFALLTPDAVGSISALYSFGITGALILLLERLNDYTEKRYQIIDLMPSQSETAKKQRKYIVSLRKFFTPVAVAAVALAASCGISISSQNIFTPGSLPANLLLTLLTPLLFGAMLLKLTLGTIFSFADQIGAFLLESSFQLLADAAGHMVELFSPLALYKPPFWSVALFYFCLFAALGLRSAKTRWWFCFAALVIAGCWFFISPSRVPYFMAISNGNNTPAMLAIVFPTNDYAFIMDIPDKNSARLASILLQRHGCRKAAVCFSSGTARAAGGTGYLANDLNLTIFYPQSMRSPTEAFRSLMQHQKITFFETGGIMQYEVPKRDEIKIKNIRNYSISSTITGSGRSVEVRTPSGNIYRELLPWASHPVVWECELK